MHEAVQSLGGARWLSVEPKGSMEKLGEFLANMGFVTPGQQSFALAGAVLLFIGIVWAMSRPIQPKVARGGRIVRSSGSSLATRRAAPAAMTPLPAATGTHAERGATIPLRPSVRVGRSKSEIDVARRSTSADAARSVAGGG